MWYASGVAQALPRRSYIPARHERAITTWLELATGFSGDGDLDAIVDPLRIIRADQGLPRPALPYLSYMNAVGSQTNGRDERNLSQTFTSVTLTVTASAAGESATLVVNPLRLSHTLTGAQTAEDARDELLLRLSESVEPVDGVAGAGAEFTLTPQQPGELVEVRAIDGVTLDSSVEELVQHAQGSRSTRWRIQLHGPSDAATDPNYIDMDQWADAILTSLTEQSTLDSFRSLGVAHNGVRPNTARATVQSGGRAELRLFFDITIATWADLARPTDLTVDTVEVAPMVLLQ